MVSIPFKREGTGEQNIDGKFAFVYIVSIPFKREGTGELGRR